MNLEAGVERRQLEDLVDRRPDADHCDLLAAGMCLLVGNQERAQAGAAHELDGGHVQDDPRGVLLQRLRQGSGELLLGLCAQPAGQRQDAMTRTQA